MQPQPKVIKRYSNRKLYDTERSCYVTLDEISQMVKDGVEVKIIDNKTKDDLTSVTLTQIIFAEEKKQKQRVVLVGLRMRRWCGWRGSAVGSVPSPGSGWDWCWPWRDWSGWCCRGSMPRHRSAPP